MSIQFLNSCKRCHCWSNIIQTLLGHRLRSDVFLKWCCWHTTVHARIAIGWQGVVCATSIVSAALWRIRAEENRPCILYIFQTIFGILQNKWNSLAINKRKGLATFPFFNWSLFHTSPALSTDVDLTLETSSNIQCVAISADTSLVLCSCEGCDLNGSYWNGLFCGMFVMQWEVVVTWAFGMTIQMKAFEYFHAVLFSVQHLQQKVVTFRQFFILTWVLMMRCSGAYLLLKYNAWLIDDTLTTKLFERDSLTIFSRGSFFAWTSSWL